MVFLCVIQGENVVISVKGTNTQLRLISTLCKLAIAHYPFEKRGYQNITSTHINMDWLLNGTQALVSKALGCCRAQVSHHKS